MILWLHLFAGSSEAFARTYDNSLRKSVTYKTDLGQLSDLSNPRLDWRNPKMNISFELPASDWVDSVDLFLNVHAEKRPNRTAPLYVHFNNAPAMPIYPKGHSFTAQISLDKSYIRARRNVIGMSYSKVDGCIEPSDGSWTIDLDDSLILVKSTTPSTTFDMTEVKDILSSSLSAPGTVSIIASGADKLTYEALTAQGVALNMNELPRFSLSSGGDMEVFIGTRSNLKSVLRGTELADMPEAALGVTRNAPLRLVMTADNEPELLKLVQNFASYSLPTSGKSHSTKSDFVWSQNFAGQYTSVLGKTDIYDIEYLSFDRGWGENAQTLDFDVDNPLTAQGTAKLYFHRGKQVTASSTVNVELNGESLGTIPLTHKRNIVEFDIPRGMLHGAGNKLRIAPELTPVDMSAGCSGGLASPEFYLEDRSYIDIKNEASGYAGDLTRLSASAYPFSGGAGSQTNIILSSRYNSDKTAGLRILARLAKAYGSGLTDAKYYTLGETIANPDKHSLLIGPRLDANAPKGLASLMDGRLQKPKVIQTALLDIKPVSLLSVREGSRISGGVAALYQNTQYNGRLRGYITSSRGHSFNRAVEYLLAGDHWAELQGSLARWNRSKVEMGKTAFNIDVAVPAAPVLTEGFDAPKFSMPAFNTPKVDLSPVQDRIAGAGQSAVNGIAAGWNVLSLKITEALNSDSKQDVSSMPKQDVQIWKPQAKPVPVKQSEPAVQQDLAAKYDLTQYRPGRVAGTPSLRKQTLEKLPRNQQIMLSDPVVKTSVTTAMKDKVSGMYGYMSSKVDDMIYRTQNSVFVNRGTESTKANALLLAMFMMLFLLTIGLVRPRS